jgi:hypothetical protein
MKFKRLFNSVVVKTYNKSFQADTDKSAQMPHILVQCIMIKLILALMMFFSFYSNSFACLVPLIGDKYNSLITVEQIDDSKNYSFKIRSNVRQRNISRVFVLFDIKTSDGYSRSDDWLHVQFSIENEFAVGKLSLDPTKPKSSLPLMGSLSKDKKIAYLPYLHVVWNNEAGFVCPIIGKSSYLGKFGA